MEVHHPAAKLIAMASKMQEDECGDGTNFVITLAGEMLEQAESLIKMGLHPSLILAGYEEASKKCIELLDSLESIKCTDPRDQAQVQNFLMSPLTSKLSEFILVLPLGKPISSLVSSPKLALGVFRKILPTSTLKASE